MTSIISIRYSDIDVRSVIAKAAKAVPTENARSGDLPLCASVDWQVLTSKDRKLDCEERGIVHGEKWDALFFEVLYEYRKYFCLCRRSARLSIGGMSLAGQGTHAKAVCVAESTANIVASIGRGIRYRYSWLHNVVSPSRLCTRVGSG